MTLAEFAKEQPQIAAQLRSFTGDYTGAGGWQERDMGRYGYVQSVVNGVYPAYEDGVLVWYAFCDGRHGTDMAVYKGGAWAWGEGWSNNHLKT